jgi:four helix bundle protein
MPTPWTRSQEPGARSQNREVRSEKPEGRDGMEKERQKAKTFRDLIVWRKAHELVIEIYRLTPAFPKSEMFGLAQQIRRAAVSIPANIAEGFVRRGKADKVRSMNIAESSLEECRYYLILVPDLGYGQTDRLITTIEEVSKMLNAYERAILASDY